MGCHTLLHHFLENPELGSLILRIHRHVRISPVPEHSPPHEPGSLVLHCTQGMFARTTSHLPQRT
jgi:hypothetical protein